MSEHSLKKPAHSGGNCSLLVTWTPTITPLGGIKWILDLEEGDAQPNPKLSAEQEKKAKANAGK